MPIVMVEITDGTQEVRHMFRVEPISAEEIAPFLDSLGEPNEVAINVMHYLGEDRPIAELEALSKKLGFEQGLAMDWNSSLIVAGATKQDILRLLKLKEERNRMSAEMILIFDCLKVKTTVNNLFPLVDP